ncbi:MAG TPA: prepilin-type N-terminal cleavage/methylation domain-containing protein [Burkholderiales bacterium]|nr:prepilin-type N-terminal cleavage/methylation domain-containing protein [Burkholderiales bacterium]
MKAIQKGFTLVEIAIVLVIIGLLLGGILKGQEMITQAKIKNVIADFSGISAAYHGYQDRYRAIPGDDKGASRWTGISNLGDGDGRLAGLYNSATATDESRLWWEDLRRSGFITGTGNGQPLNAVSGMIGVQTGDGANPPNRVLSSANPDGFGGLIICSANLPDKIAIAVDTQMDDGVPNAGTVRAQLQATLNPTIGATADTAYAETGTNSYTVCRSLN